MRINKACGKIFGAQLSAAEKKALKIEINRQLAEYDTKHKLELQALFLWTLHEQLGFGEKRLRQFFDIFDKALDDLIERYDLEESDSAWLCTLKLKEHGISIEDWNDNKENNRNGKHV